MTEWNQGTPEQRQEALSKRYVDAARVVEVTSEVPTRHACWAVFSLAQGDLVGVVESEMLPMAIAEACSRSTRYWEEAKEKEALRRVQAAPPEVQKTEINLEDLGF